MQILKVTCKGVNQKLNQITVSKCKVMMQAKSSLKDFSENRDAELK